MYFWKTKTLASDIKSGNFSEKDRKNYYLATSILVAISLYLGYLEPPTNFYPVLIEVIGIIAVIIIGINITFKSNNGNDGQDYLGKMTALSLPLLIKLIIISLVFGIVIGIVFGSVGNKGIQEWLMSLFIILIQIVFFWRLNVHIKSINT